MSELIYYSVEYRVRVCLQHKHAVRDLARHLRDEHTGLSLLQRKEIIDQHQSDDCLKPEEFIPPQQAVPALAFLQDPVTVLQCIDPECQRRVVSEVQMAAHCNRQHDWRKSATAPEHWSRIRAQTFFLGALTKYFPVTEQTTSQTTDTTLQTTTVAPSTSQALPGAELTLQQQKILEKTLQDRVEATRIHQARTEQADQDISKEDRTGWYTRTGWPQHFAGRNIVQISNCSRLPEKSEAVLSRVVGLFDTVWQRAVAGLSGLDHETRRWLRSPKETEPDVRPLARLQTDAALERYATYLRRFLCYVFRLWVVDEKAKAEGTATTSATGRAQHSDSSDAAADSDASSHKNTGNTQEDITFDARQLFPWQPGLRDAVQQIYSSVTDTDTADPDLMLQLFATLILSNIGQDSYSSSLVHFAAVLGIDAENRRFRSANDYSYVLAGLIYGFRVLAVDRLIPTHDRDDTANQLQVREQFLRQRAQYLVDGSYSPTSTLLSLLAYSKHIALQTSNRGRISWTPDRRTIYYYGHPISLDAFRRMVADILTRAEDLFWTQLLWVPEPAGRFTIGLRNLVDDMTVAERGYSFIQRDSNQLQHGFTWMVERMTQLTGTQRLQRRGEWRPTRIRRYLRLVHQFWRLLLLSVHIVGGMPARGSEVLSICFRNGLYQDRNLYLIDGCIVVVTRYHKSQSLMDQVKVIPRRLTPRLSQLVTIYLVYLQPFQEHLRYVLTREDRSDYLWSSNTGPWQTEQLTTALQQETLAWLGRSCTTLDYRHLAISIGREIAGSMFLQGLDEDEGQSDELEAHGEDAFELQSGHGQAIGQLRYGVSLDIVRDLSAQSLTVFRGVSEKWHQFLQLPESGDPSQFPVATTSVTVTHRATGRHKRDLSEETQRQTPRRDRPFPGARAITEETTNSLVPATVSTRLYPATVSDHSDRITGAMRQLFDADTVRFTSRAQQQGIQAVLNGESPVVVVLPTGGGKTVLPMVAAVLDPDGVYVLITPLRALTEEMVTRFRAVQIRCQEWRYDTTDTATVLVVSADIAASYAFLTYLHQLQRQDRLRRVFIDEAHLTLTASSWRPKLGQLQRLRVLSCPFILLSATVPPFLEPEFEQGLGIRQARYIRTSTVRPHHRYYVQHCDGDQLTGDARQLCRRWQQRIGASKGIVYCKSRVQCDQLAADLDCRAYHAELVTRDRGFADWCQTGGLIVATSALGTGINIPQVLVVIHIDLPWSMVDFAQESGRGGRDGTPVDSIILVNTHQVQARLQQGQYPIDQAAIADFVTTRQCRRWVMSEYLDGVGLGRRCADLSEGGCCDRCGDGVSVRYQQQRSQVTLQQYAQRMFDELSSECVICWIFGQPDQNDHRAQQCERQQARGCSGAAIELFRRQVRYSGRSTSCHRCGIDQRWCDSGLDPARACQWPFLLTPMVRCVLTRRLYGPMLQRLGFPGEAREVRRYGRWVSEPHPARVCGLWMSNGMAVVVAVFSLLRRPEVPMDQYRLG